MTRRRDMTRVIHDILSLCRQSVSKTELIYKGNLSFHLAEEYLSYLLSKQHLQSSIDSAGFQRYRLTESGGRLLSFLVEVQKELEGLLPRRGLTQTDLTPVPSFQEWISTSRITKIP